MALYCLPTLVFLVTEEPAVGFVAQCLRGAATMVVDVLAITALQRSVPADRLGRVFGAFDGLCLGAILVGSALIPVGIRLLGLDAMLWFTGLGVPVLCLLGLPALRRLDAESAVRRAELAPRIALLSRSGLFASVSEGALEQLASQAVREEVPAGTVVIAQGEPADAFYVAESGDFEVTAPRGGRGRGRLCRPWARAPASARSVSSRASRVRRPCAASADAVLLRIPGEAFVAALTQEAPTAALLDGASLRLSRTHPTRRLTQAGIPRED